MPMAGYTKLFNSILASTIWREDDKTRILWITLLAMADKHGIAEGSVPGLADLARVSLADCEHSLKRLSEPDQYSRSKVHDGRRIKETEGGWQLINHGKYREKMNADDRREYLRLKQAEHRQQKSTNVNTRSAQRSMSTHASPYPFTPTEEDLGNSRYLDHSRDMGNAREAERAAPIKPSGNGGVQIGSLPREHLKHAYCDKTFSRCVPDAVHAKLIGLLAPKHAGDRTKAANELKVWYPTIVDALPPDFVMGDAFRFWQPKFDATLASPEITPARKSQRLTPDAKTHDAETRAILKRDGVIK